MAISRREREKTRKRDEILFAAHGVFAEKGYEHATVDEIAQRAEFSKGALYSYFQNKEEIFVATLEESFADMERMVASAFDNQLPVREKFRLFTKELFTYFEEHADVLTILVKEEMQMKMKTLCEFRERYLDRRENGITKMAAPLSEAMMKGGVREMDAVTLVEAYRNMVFGFILLHRFRKEPRSLLDEVDTLVTIFFDGIALK